MPGLVLALAAALWSSACAISQEVGSDCVDEISCEQARLARSGAARAGLAQYDDVMQAPPRLTRSGFIQRVDVLMVVDSSPAMVVPQTLLSDALPHFVNVLASGDIDGGGSPEFRPVSDVHFGVISGRMQTAPDPGQKTLNEQRSCGGGSDGELSSFGCLPAGQTFARLQGRTSAAAVGAQLACMARVGNAICEPPQLFDSALKALWPSNHDDPLYGVVTFGDGSDAGLAQNSGFLRDDSLIVVIVVTDSDDCSLAASAGLAGLDPGALLHRCSVTPDVRFDLSRYVNGLRSLRAGAEDLVMFYALGGVPPGPVSPSVLNTVSFERDDQREAFYDTLLASPGFEPGTYDDRGTVDPGDDLPAQMCRTASGPIYPARRLTELARAFGPNGLVQSACATAYAPALDAILRSIGRRLGPPGI